MKTPAAPDTKPQPLRDALKLGRTAFLFAALFSLVSNLLYLAMPIYTNQIYSRVLSSHSGSTLIVLTIGTMFVFLVSNIIDYFRAQVLSGFSVIFDRQVASRTFAALFEAVVQRRGGAHAQPLRDLDTIRDAISGSAVSVMFDLPWIPIFLGVLFVIDPWVGTATTIGGLILLGLAIGQDRATRQPLRDASDAAIQSYGFTDAALRNAEVVRAIGMLPTLGAQWAQFRATSLDAGTRAGTTAAAYGSAIRLVRIIIQIVTIALGAFLVIDGKISSGILFANMILAARALAPLERIVGSWKGLFAAAESYQRLNAMLQGYEPTVAATRLPRPTGQLTVENVSFAPANAPALVLVNLSFQIAPGEMIGIVGPSGAGKSTLTRLLVGIWKPRTGTVRLDGADVFSWDRESFGRYVAYQPQDTELFSGTVRANICRFRADANDDDIVEAAQMAGAHDLILRLPKGYDTELGEGAAVLSSGQRQRVGLARTLFGKPQLVVLDEPNANLDAEGELALKGALKTLKDRGATVVIVSHKVSAFAHADKILVLKNGMVGRFGPRDAVLADLRAAPPARPALAEVKS